ncbi:hypothetical protein B0H12DRAFT_1228983 [Mycena haematopus]|nr:hypothetical protein B0H12DRAFT_1228983 [Mycena haematopus]
MSFLFGSTSLQLPIRICIHRIAASQSCPNFQSSLDISVSGFAAVDTQFGYYLEATIVPPAVQQAYVYFKAGAGAEGKNQQLVFISADNRHITKLPLPLPALLLPPGTMAVTSCYYPGLRTLGPSLHLYGELSGQLSLSGTYKTCVSYTFPNLDLSFGKQDSNAGQSNFGSAVAPTNNYGGVLLSAIQTIV